MNQEIKKQWVAALRSGNYDQGRRRLKSSNNEFCCLGVLCDVTKLGYWQPGRYGTYVTSGYGNQSAYLNDDMTSFIGLKNNDAEVLMGMNDTEEKTFPEIADYIEKNL